MSVHLFPAYGHIVKLTVALPEPLKGFTDLVSVTLDPATENDLEQAAAADPETTQRLLDCVRPKQSAIGFGAIAADSLE